MLSFDAIGGGIVRLESVTARSRGNNDPQPYKIAAPQVLVVINSTSSKLRSAENRAALQCAKQALEKEKNALLDFLTLLGYKADCVIENKTKGGMFLNLEKRTNRTRDGDHDSVMLWFLGIASDSKGSIQFAEDDSFSIDEAHALFKSGSGARKFLNQPKLFFFLSVQGIAPTYAIKAPFDASRSPADADFWNCLMDRPLDCKQVVLNLVIDIVLPEVSHVELEDIMYELRRRWAGISTRLPTSSGSLRYDIHLCRRRSILEAHLLFRVYDEFRL